jgi:hypothetical protein
MERLLSKSQKKIIKKNPKLTNVCKDREKWKLVHKTDDFNATSKNI